ncbi:MAG: SLBB domain-containing protein [Candidatus Zixiibacteriota bacterium]
MRTLLFIIVLVIVLVSLNWFLEAHAQELSELQGIDKTALARHMQLSGKANPQSGNYQSPVIYDSTPPAAGPTEPSPAVPVSVQNGKMLEFDELKPFGLELFGGPAEAAPPEEVAVSADYLLGPGDNVLVNLWGRVEQGYNLTIDREGKVFIPKVGELVAWGKTLDQFQRVAKQRLSAVYSEFDLTASLGKIRSIRIYLTGEVNRPGAYTVSSLTSLFNALYLAGGPNANGSMREIRLMRQGKAVAVLDLYKFLLEGDNASDIRLESGDAIFVPVAGARVAIRGAIRRPAIYELKGAETPTELLLLAGNATPEAHLDRVMLERISGRKEWQVLDLNLNPAQPQMVTDLPLTDGDRVTVYSIFDAKKNMVAVAGKVKHPGYYERTDSTRIADLLAQGQLQDYDVYFERADLFRKYKDHRVSVIPVNLRQVLSGDPEQNLVLNDLDSLQIYAIDHVQRTKYVFVEGEVRRPGQYPLYDSMTVADLIFLAGSFTRGASRLQGEIARTDSLGEVALLPVMFDGSDSLRTLAEDDRLYVRPIPEWQLHRTVLLEGEVQFPGEYVMASRDETLYQLLLRAGGFTRNAFPTGIVFERRSISRNLERLQIPKLVQRSVPIVEDSAGNLEQQMVVDYDSAAVNRVIINMDRILASTGRDGDMTLEPGDRVFIPPVPSGISVMGEVGATGTIKYLHKQNVRYYIERAGNFTPRSDKKLVRLIKADGRVFAGGGTLGRRVEVGDLIVVPAKIKKDRDVLKIVSTAFAATTSVLTSILLIDKL